MGWFDLVILAVILLSTLISLVRGFVKESISLATWLAAGILSLIYYAVLADLILPYVNFSVPFLDPPKIAVAAAITLLFLSTLIVGAIINFMVGQLVSKTGLSGTDKTLGMVFGAARGVLIVSMVVLMAELTAIPSQEWWQDSMLVEHFSSIAQWIKNFMPQDVANQFSL